ncbi:SRPBCC domain-containing protein [Arthrobacter sp. I2-34]|uniref:SRPBCC domain-containing protein n=1 Tax=Arthrobacter hankyongi TaxID=2904801 RepID=A0ABS9L692_9MICC|nr:SRPBCC domain-containing protein [Arthrobacter hankyongi]MCG2622200.1 SRPBCC domain-containing protein [Arthrobacter hankyongi]
MEAVDQIQLETTISAPLDRVWTAFAHERGQWWPELDFWPVIGSLLREEWEVDGVQYAAVGAVKDVISGRRLVFAWSEPDWDGATTVRWEFEAAGTGTRVLLTETGFGSLAHGQELAEDHRETWPYHLSDLKEHAERQLPAG